MLHIVTLVLDGMPWLEKHLAQFTALKIPWHWTIVEGVAAPVNCTSWCKEIEPRLSLDGTSEYLDSIEGKNVTVIRQHLWQGKLEMLNTAVSYMHEPGVILEVDSDELWKTAQLEQIHRLFVQRNLGKAYFFCRYFVGPDIITVGENCYGNHGGYEWLRAWKYASGHVFQRHERPMFNHNMGTAMMRHDTRNLGLCFDHMAYATEKQVAFKQEFYGYENAVEHWNRLQQNNIWPVRRLKDFLPWVDEKVGANRLA